MTHLIIKPYTLADAWELYSRYLKSNDKRQYYLVKMALFKYTLPAYGLVYEAIGTKAKDEEALAFLKTIHLSQFVDVLNIQQSFFDSSNIKKYVQRANRHRLKQMLTWCSSQEWWQAATNTNKGYYAPRRRNNLGNAHHAKVTDRKRTKTYCLKPHEISSDLQKSLNALEKFQTRVQVKYRQDPCVTKITSDKTCRSLLLILGWLHHCQGIPLAELNFQLLDNIDIAYDYTEWIREENKVSPKTEVIALVALLNLAKFLHYQESDYRYCKSINKNYIDIPLICDLRELIRVTNERIKTVQKTVNESVKWLDWPDYLLCVQYLLKDCSPYTSDGQARTPRAIAGSYQKYLIAALLAYMPPDRQRTFRELEVGKTLVRGSVKNSIFIPQINGKWYIKLGPAHYKTGKAYGEIILEVPEIIYSELEYWLNHWRQVLSPNHNFIFTQLNGKPLTSGSLRGLFRHAIYRASKVLFGEGKAPNPHLVRDMAVTHFVREGASEAQMEALAIAMKHSRRTQREIYDRRTQNEKVAPAQDMMLKAAEQVAKKVII
ncbi:MAG: hypothetical protein VKJ02_14445 [Snowella sp.]|nr:hypothetical protein [Snowella sp.]